MNEQSPEQRRIAGNEARQLLENKHLKAAFSAVAEYLEGLALTCDPDDKDKSARIIQGKQILARIEREITRIVEDGEVAEVQIAEIERQRKPKVFSRLRW